MGFCTIPFNVSEEARQHIDKSVSNFAKAQYAHTSDHSFGYEIVQHQQGGATNLTQKLTFQPFKSEALWHHAQLRVRLSPLAAAANPAPGPFTTIAWRRNIAFQAIKNVTYIFGNEDVYKVPGTWIWLESLYANNVEQRQDPAETGNLPLAQRVALAASAYTFDLSLRPFWEFHRGLNLFGASLRSVVKIEVEFRAGNELYETNYAPTVAENLTTGIHVEEAVLLWQTVCLNAAEGAEYLKPETKPFKDVDAKEHETITAQTEYRQEVITRGVAEGFFIGFRSATGAGTAGTNESLYMDRPVGTISVVINNQDVWTQHPMDKFRTTSWQKHLAGQPDSSEDCEFLYIPMALRADQLASSGLLDLNVPSRVELKYNFDAAFTGDVSLYTLKRNFFENANGKLVKLYR